ncbi:MAG: hypothetical protein KAU90_02030 [Sulfurovaceae bacterium]|nr:hypothetical protein [Sulfurovaceae bacterium]
MTLFILAKITHIISIIFFIGVVSFRTFIMPVIRTKYEKQTYMEIDKLTGMRARSIIKINNIFLILSGAYLFSLHLDSATILLYLKVSIGLLLALTFYIVPLIMQKFKEVKWFLEFFHYLFFGLTMLVVVLSQVMFL